MTYLTDADREALAEWFQDTFDYSWGVALDAVDHLAGSDWLAAHDARVAAETRESVLGEAEQAFREQGEAWGGRSAWLTSGKHVSDLCVWVVRGLRGGEAR